MGEAFHRTVGQKVEVDALFDGTPETGRTISCGVSLAAVVHRWGVSINVYGDSAATHGADVYVFQPSAHFVGWGEVLVWLVDLLGWVIRSLWNTVVELYDYGEMVWLGC